MTDEHPNDENIDQDHETPLAASGSSDSDAGVRDEDIDLAQDADGETDNRQTPPRGATFDRKVANAANLGVLGVLVVSTTTRDFELLMDGDAGLRCLSAFAHGRLDREGDLLDAAISSANNAWTVLDLSTVVGMTWVPGLPKEAKPERIALDPLVA